MTTETVNLFEVASRMKLRFESTVGQLSVEELWSLPLSSSTNKVSLDALAVALNKQLKGTEESFVSNTKKDEVVKLKFDIVKYIIDVRQEENRAKTEAAQRQARKAQIDELIARKEVDALGSMTLEELKALKESI